MAGPRNLRRGVRRDESPRRRRLCSSHYTHLLPEFVAERCAARGRGPARHRPRHHQSPGHWHIAPQSKYPIRVRTRWRHVADGGRPHRSLRSSDLATNAPHGVEHALRRLNYDIAGTAFAPAIAALRNLVPVSQILLGSDYPYVPIGDTVDGMRSLGFSPEELDAIGRDNALRLLPTLCCA